MPKRNLKERKENAAQSPSPEELPVAVCKGNWSSQLERILKEQGNELVLKWEGETQGQKFEAAYFCKKKDGKFQGHITGYIEKGSEGPGPQSQSSAAGPSVDSLTPSSSSSNAKMGQLFKAEVPVLPFDQLNLDEDKIRNLQSTVEHVKIHDVRLLKDEAKVIKPKTAADVPPAAVAPAVPVQKEEIITRLCSSVRAEVVRYYRNQVKRSWKEEKENIEKACEDEVVGTGSSRRDAEKEKRKKPETKLILAEKCVLRLRSPKTGTWKLKPIFLKDMDNMCKAESYKNSVLFVTVIDDPAWVMMGADFGYGLLLVEDDALDVARVYVYKRGYEVNYQGAELFAYGTKLAIVEPDVWISDEGKSAIHVEFPHKRLVRLGKMEERCRFCGKPEAPSHCARCKTAKYCSRECQVLDWKKMNHQAVCGLEWDWESKVVEKKPETKCKH